MASTSTSPKQEPVPIPIPIPIPLPLPEPQAHSTPLAIATVASPNPETPSYEPPMGVPLPLLLTAPPATRRLPPPCWTPDETSVLIDAYRVKWYSLRRGNLRAAHWQDVADQIHSACPDVLPPKTSVQCRHKMEKLRKRYRAELLRAKSIPHHSFSSSWLYFSRMDAMEKNIDVPAVASLPSPQPLSYAPSLDPTPPPPRYSTPPHLQHQHQHHDNHNDNANDDDDADDDDDDDEEGFTPHSQPIYLQPKAAFATPTYQHPDPHRIRPSSNPRTAATFAAFNDSPPPNFKTAYAHKTTSYGTPPHYNGARFVNNHDTNNNATPGPGPGPGPSRMGMAMKMDMNYMHVNSSTGGDTMKKKKKRRKMNNGGEERRERAKDKGDEAGMEMVEAIRMLGEGFVRMEKMKMEMIRETERMRMDMEMKRTQMLLDSQHRIVEAFAKGWSDVINNNNKNDDAHQDDAS